MGGSLSQVFRSGSALLSTSHGHKTSEQTAATVRTVFDALVANPKVSLQRLEGLLLQIPKNENIQQIHDECGYSLLQKCVGLNHVELVRWLLTRRHLDVNRCACSLPLHIACLKGYEECVELLLKHGAKIDAEARMCFPGPHLRNCEESGKYKTQSSPGLSNSNSMSTDEIKQIAEVAEGQDFPAQRQINKLQSAICYAIDGDQVNILNLLTQKMEEPWVPFRVRKPLLHIACERAAWKCVQHLVNVRSEELHMLRDEYYPIHQAVPHDLKFLELLLQHGADPSVRTCTQQMSLLHIVLLVARKSAEDTLATIRLLLERGCKEIINAPDSLGNTPLHALVVRYALEEAHYGYDRWSKWDVLTLAHALLAAGARHSANKPGNSALAYLLRHVRDWDVCYELLNMLLTHGAEPNAIGRDGSAPIMVCLVPLINKDPLHHFNHSMKVCYLNCIRILLQYGANPNCCYRCNLTPLHVLVFAISENITLNCEQQKRSNFDFLKNLLVLLLQHGLDCNVRVSINTQHILQSCADMVSNVRSVEDLSCVHQLMLTLMRYGADPNTHLSDKSLMSMFCSESESHITHSREPIENRNSFRNGSKNFILYYFVALIVRKENILLNPEMNYAGIMHLFYLTMEHAPLYACLKSLHTQYIAQVPAKATEPVIALIKEMYRVPRSLKQLARLQIYQSLGRKPAVHINKLSLPQPLKEYILNVDL